MFEETSTIGLRYRVERRIELERTPCKVTTRYGTVTVKLASLDGRVVQAWPESEECATLARRHDVALATVQQAALDELRPSRRKKK